MSGNAAWQQLNVPVRFTRRTCSQNSGVILTKRLKVEPMPGVVDQDGDRSELAPDLVDRGEDLLPVSHVDRETDGPFRPPRRWPPAAPVAASLLRSRTATAWPSAARRRLMARPIPEPPPVTIATRCSLMGPPSRRVGATTVSPRRRDRFTRLCSTCRVPTPPRHGTGVPSWRSGRDRPRSRTSAVPGLSCSASRD